MKSKGRIAFVKFGGLSAGGTERWLQTMAVLMQQRGFTIDYYFLCIYIPAYIHIYKYLYQSNEP